MIGAISCHLLHCVLHCSLAAADRKSLCLLTLQSVAPVRPARAALPSAAAPPRCVPAAAPAPAPAPPTRGRRRLRCRRGHRCHLRSKPSGHLLTTTVIPSWAPVSPFCQLSGIAVVDAGCSSNAGTVQDPLMGDAMPAPAPVQNLLSVSSSACCRARSSSICRRLPCSSRICASCCSSLACRGRRVVGPRAGATQDRHWRPRKRAGAAGGGTCTRWQASGFRAFCRSRNDC